MTPKATLNTDRSQVVKNLLFCFLYSELLEWTANNPTNRLEDVPEMFVKTNNWTLVAKLNVLTVTWSLSGSFTFTITNECFFP